VRRPLRRRAAPGERGETLVEVLMTVSIMGVLFAAVLGALAVSMTTSDISKKEGATEALLRSYAEQVQGLPYASCGTVSSYTISGFAFPPGYTGYTVGPTAVKYWNGANPAGFVTTCPSPDPGVQAIDLRAQTADGRASETMTVYKRVP
jgi:prepilin-type N-terminal cleavage/methylation domain-containing protein